MRLAQALTTGFVFCASLLAAGVGQSTPIVQPRHLRGDWVGERHGQSVMWHLDASGRLRIDGRPADYSIRGDTLTVCFDPSLRSETGQRETAIYRFMASLPSRGPARLFVYGFDLGNKGLWLEREMPPDPNPPEDTAPAPPAPGAKPGSPLGGRAATPESTNPSTFAPSPTSSRR